MNPSPFADGVERWLELPDLVADYAQQEDGLVWTRAQDALSPGLGVGDEVVAAWGEQVWRARIVAATEEAIGPGWQLQPLSIPAARPRIEIALVPYLSAEQLDQIGAAVADLQHGVDELLNHVRSAREVIGAAAAKPDRVASGRSGTGLSRATTVARWARRPVAGQSTDAGPH